MYAKFSNRISQLSLSRRMPTCMHAYTHTLWRAASEAVPSGLSPGIGASECRPDLVTLFKESDMAKWLGVARRLPTWRPSPPPCPPPPFLPSSALGKPGALSGVPWRRRWSWGLSLLPTDHVNWWLVSSVQLGWDVDFPGWPRPTRMRCNAGHPPAEPWLTTWETWVRGNCPAKQWSNYCVWFEVTRSWGSLSHGETSHTHRKHTRLVLLVNSTNVQ